MTFALKIYLENSSLLNRDFAFIVRKELKRVMDNAGESTSKAGRQ